MRSHPIGTGPFKFVAFKPNERVTVGRNPDYWKKVRPYLDGIEWTIMPSVSTRMLAFIAGQSDIASPYGVTIPLLKDVQRQAPHAICEITATNISHDLIINRAVPPFDNPDLRRAMALSLDRKAFIDILTGGQGDIGGAMLQRLAFRRSLARQINCDRGRPMNRNFSAFAAASALLVAIAAAGPASAQKQGGILRMYSPDRPC